MIINGIVLILQYILLFLIYYFIYKVLVLIYCDLKKEKDRSAHLIEQAKLTVIAADDSNLMNHIFNFDNMITIGRDTDNDIVIDDKYVSHYHAKIIKKKNDYVLQDLQSANRTYLNDLIVSKEEMIKKGDSIKIGMITFKFER